ncbi:MAG: OmpA family protein [Prevotellaceae bacterium]|jgi:peptidoglycan-associated lipoprotein|nr:OmpA family protein [Prevotellaceae bacterium]MDR0560853.1 OmpA family protein [Prevotellaceae bacterium]
MNNTRNNLILFCLTMFTVVSCGVNARLKKANEIYEAGGYDKSANLYKKVAPKIKKDKSKKAETYFKAGEAYRKSGNSLQAGRNYDMAIRNGYKNAAVFMHAAAMALMNDDVEKAQNRLKTFRDMEPNNRQGVVLQQSCEMILSDKSAKSRQQYKVENMKIFNSKYHDFSPSYASSDYETVFFTSSRKDGAGKTKTFEATGQNNADIYKSVLTKKGWETPQPLDNTINTVDEEGASVFNSNYTTIYYTQCVKENGEKFGCSIMTAKSKGDSWTEPEKLKLVSDSMVAAHAALSADGLTMYFSSNVFGGFGGLDLWKTGRGNEDDNFWSEPVNLGSQINTPGDEVFPTLRGDTLYFSSNGRAGYGGLDIYKAWQDSDGIWTTVNMGKPFNSNADDFGIVFEGENERGYFCSRRKGGRGGDDIYSFKMDIPVIEFDLKGTVRDAKRNVPLAAAEVVLHGSDGSSLKRVTEKDGTFRFRLAKNTEYMAVVRRSGYFVQKSGRINTEGLTESKTFTQNLLITPYSEIVEIPNIFFEYGKADLSKESTAALDNLIALMNENPKIVISLIAHTDNRGSEGANMNLSQRRAQAVVDYLVFNGVDDERLEAKGMGESQPRKVTAEIAAKYKFLKTGQVLSEEFINSLQDNDQKETCHALNRRTEIKVLSEDYEPNP